MQEEKGNEVLNNNPQQVAQNIEKEKKVDWLKILPWAFVVFLVIFGTTFYLLGFFTQEAEDEFTFTQEVDEVEIVQEQKEGGEYEFEVPAEEGKSEVYYNVYSTEDGTANIFSYDLGDGSVKKLTNETSATMGNERIQDLRVIDENKIGFIKTSEIYSTSLEVGEDEKLYDGGGTGITALDFHTKSKFAFLQGLQPGERELALFEDGSVRILGDIKEIGGERGKHFYDNTKIEFSGDAHYLFLNIVEDTLTSSVSKYSANLHVYDLMNNTNQVIEDATHAMWLDEENIIYVALDFVEDEVSDYAPADAPVSFVSFAEGVYKYNVVNQSKTKIPVKESKDIGHPSYFSNKLAYVVDFNEIWTYDFESDANERKFPQDSSESLEGQITSRITSLSWLDSNSLIYSLRVGGDGGIGAYTTLKILDLEKEEDKEIVNEGLFEFAL